METQSPNIRAGQIRIRPAGPDDVNFIFNSWLKSYRHSLAATEIKNEVYFGQHHKLIEGLLKNCEVWVVCDDKEPTTLYGYSCTQQIEGLPVVHYVYVKETYRRLGLAKLLLDKAKVDLSKPFFYTHRTRSCRHFDERYVMVFNPYISYMAWTDAYREGVQSE